MLNLLKIFTAHPKSVGMTYQQHMHGSLNYSKQLLTASYKAFIHAFLPFMYETSTTDTIKNIQDDMNKIHNN